MKKITNSNKELLISVGITGGILAGTTLGVILYERKVRAALKREVIESNESEELLEELVDAAKIMIQRQTTLKGIKEINKALDEYKANRTAGTRRQLKAVMKKWEPASRTHVNGTVNVIPYL